MLVVFSLVVNTIFDKLRFCRIISVITMVTFTSQASAFSCKMFISINFRIPFKFLSLLFSLM